MHAQNKIATRSRLVVTFGGLGSLPDRRPKCNKNTKSIRRRVMGEESWTRELMARKSERKSDEQMRDVPLCTLSVGKIQCLGKQPNGKVLHSTIGQQKVKVSLRQGKLDLAADFEG